MPYKKKKKKLVDIFTKVATAPLRYVKRGIERDREYTRWKDKQAMDDIYKNL